MKSRQLFCYLWEEGKLSRLCGNVSGKLLLSLPVTARISPNVMRGSYELFSSLVTPDGVYMIQYQNACLLWLMDNTLVAWINTDFGCCNNLWVVLCIFTFQGNGGLILLSSEDFHFKLVYTHLSLSWVYAHTV
ncbi:hypothetical protein RHMOL_Rhmol10G0156700 [Rhododendron molle]|uniref:Uncharacterized protein n=1 Tax=Rhododendron molle TaxID=49168 RepID=A0ACC0M2E1_RHOML|nr:hypothetical protein RHMOL_Rhmol10G0156700 [Rhododendron molle]